MSSQIQKPCNLIQCRQYQYIGTFLLHLFTYSGQLILSRFAGIFLIQRPYRLCGHRRTLLPDLTAQILRSGKGHLLCICLFPDLLNKGRSHRTSITADPCPHRQLFCQKLRNRRHARLSHLHQLDRTALQLSCGLQKISSIRPQSGPVRRHHQRACRTGKTGQKLSRLKKLSHILRSMKIIRRDNICLHILLFHQFTQSIQSLHNRHNKHLLFLIYLTLHLFYHSAPSSSNNSPGMKKRHKKRAETNVPLPQKRAILTFTLKPRRSGHCKPASASLSYLRELPWHLPVYAVLS